MPPKVAVGGDEDAVVRERVLTSLRELFENDKLPLSADEYEAMIPRHTVGPRWSAEDEEELQAKHKYAHIIQMGSALWESENTGSRYLWRLFPQVYRCLPTDLFSWENQVDVDTSSNSPWPADSGPDAGRTRPVWSGNFCNKLKAFAMHAFWTYKKEWDFPVMVQLMQLAVICRKNDCRPWRLVNHTEDPFFTELATEIQREDAGVRSIRDLMDSVDARMDARNLRPSQFRVLCRAIVNKCFRAGQEPIVAGTPGPYKVKYSDLEALIEVLDLASPVVGRANYNLSSGVWMRLVETARGHSGKDQRRAQPTSGDLFARAIAFGLMARERDEIIAGRELQASSSSDLFEDQEEMEVDEDDGGRRG